MGLNINCTAYRFASSVRMMTLVNRDGDPTSRALKPRRLALTVFASLDRVFTAVKVVDAPLHYRFAVEIRPHR